MSSDFLIYICKAEDDQAVTKTISENFPNRTRTESRNAFRHRTPGKLRKLNFWDFCLLEISPEGIDFAPAWELGCRGRNWPRDVKSGGGGRRAEPGLCAPRGNPRGRGGRNCRKRTLRFSSQGSLNDPKPSPKLQTSRAASCSWSTHGTWRSVVIFSVILANLKTFFARRYNVAHRGPHKYGWQKAGPA